jgi:inhibitor of cysteine peptidase
MPKCRPHSARHYVLTSALWALFALGLLSLPGCQTYDRNVLPCGQKTLAELTLMQSDNGKSVTVRPGEVVCISLYENPSTGFRWKLEHADDQVLHLLTSDYISDSSARVGGGGQHVWKFMAGKNGEVRLTMKHWRSWEGDKSAIERLDVTIRIKS